jgi:class 3 adenylate cyclase
MRRSRWKWCLVAGEELKPVTALFADIVGSTSLGERLSPEEVTALVGECVNRMSRIVEGFGGTIQAYTGDGVCVYFGVPSAHEDDPERAARAALRIVEMVHEYARDVEAAWGIGDFNVRVGINSGQMGVGMVGAAAPQALASGDSINVAARLQSSAAPGAIAIGDDTAKRLASRFILESMGSIQVKGKTQPVSAWRLVGVQPAATTAVAPPLVGREEEISKLTAAVHELRAGRGQILFISGEGGIGKTRMLAELRSLSAGNVTWLEGTCTSYETEVRASPLVDMVRSWLELEKDQPEVAVRLRLRAKLGAVVEQDGGLVLRGLSRLLGVRSDPLPGSGGDVLAAESDPSDQSREALCSWVETVCAKRPLIMAIDDLHWSDELTRELTESLFALTDHAPLMVVGAFRADPTSPAWRVRMRGLSDYPHRAVELPLQPLATSAARRLADVLVPNDQLDLDTREGLIARAEGNPLFLEELLRSVVLSAASDGSRSWSVSVRTFLPPSLESLLLARIDRLAPHPRHLVQVAAVIGRNFRVPVLERVAGRDVADDLAVLLRADLIREVRRYPELECTFRHGLIQEAALETLTAGALRELNGKVATAYEQLFADSLEEHTEALAYHHYRSNDRSKALPYLEHAAARAMDAGATVEAAELTRRARKVAEGLEATPT